MICVKDILEGKGGKVYSISPSATVFEALQMMSEKEIGALVVMENSKVVGIMSERDYARKVILLGKTSRETSVKEVMSTTLFSVKPEAKVEDAMVLMTGKHVRHLPVFEKDKFIGIISIGDVVKSIISDKNFLINQLSEYIAGKYY